jgi:intracellular sulfur oxidation DsrE/DsrF family protein
MRWYLLLALAAGCATPAGDPAPLPPAEVPPGGVRAVFHINSGDPKLHEAALKNVANVIRRTRTGAGLEVVCHGDGVELLLRDKSAHAEAVAAIRERGGVFVACENTLRDRGLTVDALLPGVVTVPSAALHILTRQHDGHAYFKP